MGKQHVQLTEAERDALEALVKKGKSSARIYRRALGLLDPTAANHLRLLLK